jgi:predicted nucleic acid-binding protein
METVILDAGPIVAYFDVNEEHHKWCVRQFASLRPPLFSCESVIAEAVYLVDARRGDSSRLFRFLREKIIQLPFQLEMEIEAVMELRLRYADLPMDLADACLVRMTEKYRNCRVFTLDGDFRVYRRHGRQVIPLIFPD